MANVDLDSIKQKVMTAKEIKAAIEQKSEVIRQEKLPDLPDYTITDIEDVVKYLPSILRDAVEELHTTKNTPLQMAVVTALSFANLVAAPHYNVETFDLWGDNKGIPISEYFVILQASSGGKSSLFSTFKKPIDEYANVLLRPQYEIDYQTYLLDENEYQKALKKGDLTYYPNGRPKPPMHYDIFTEIPTLNGLGKKLKTTHYTGIFTSEGVKFVNSYDKRNSDTDGSMVGALCDLWSDGSQSKDTGEEQYNLTNRRVSMCILIQPAEAHNLISNSRYVENGFDSRLLITDSPTDLLDENISLRNRNTAKANMKVFTDRLVALYKKQKPVSPYNNLQLEPVKLLFDAEATAWVEKHVYPSIIRKRNEAVTRRVNNEPADFGDSLAGKGFEHFLRLAATLCAIEGNAMISENNAKGAKILFDYFFDQRLGLEHVAIGSGDTKLKQAESALLAWLGKRKGKWVYKSTAMQSGARAVAKLEAGEKNRLIREMQQADLIEIDGLKIRIR